MRTHLTTEELYEAYADDVYRYLLFLLRNKEAAEDLTQDTFIRVHQQLHNFKGQAQERTWILKIARNVAFDLLRRKRRISFLAPVTSHASQVDWLTPETQLVNQEKLHHLYDSLGQLKTDYREVLILRKIHEFPIRDVAQILGWTEDKVKAKSARALKKLKDEMLKKEVGVNDATK